MSGPAGVTALVLAETVAGGLVLLFLTPLWGEVKLGFFTLTGSVLLVLSFAIRLAGPRTATPVRLRQPPDRPPRPQLRRRASGHACTRAERQEWIRKRSGRAEDRPAPAA